MARGVAASLLGAMLLGVLSTVGDSVWAHFELPHRVIYGLVHGAVIFLALGAFLGGVRGRPLAGALGGTLVGFAAAVSFYVLAPLLGYSAMFVSWMALWLGLAWLDARHQTGRSDARWLTRGLAAAVTSGLAFYAISGIWTRPNPDGPDLAVHFASWFVAFLPGLLALLVSVPGRQTN